MISKSVIRFFLIIILVHAITSKLSNHRFQKKLGKLGLFHTEPSEIERKLWKIYKLESYLKYLLTSSSNKSVKQHRQEKRMHDDDSNLPLYARDLLESFVK